MKRWIKQLVLTLGVGCLGMGLAAISVSAQEVPLMVGITPDYPPLIFRQGESITGIEIDLARKLGKELNRPVRLVTLKWEEQIDALLGEKDRSDYVRDEHHSHQGSSGSGLPTPT